MSPPEVMGFYFQDRVVDGREQSTSYNSPLASTGSSAGSQTVSLVKFGWPETVV